MKLCTSFCLVLIGLTGGCPAIESAPPSSDGGTDISDGGAAMTAQEDLMGLPPLPMLSCPPPLLPVDTSQPTTMVGDGTPGSCTAAALVAALASGGIVTFRCGPDPVTIPVAAEMLVTKDTVLDGGGKVTLSGGGKTRILKVNGNPAQSTPRLTVQNLRLADGWVSGTGSSGDISLGGAAIYRLGGSLRVVNSQFDNNHGADSGSGQSGGAIFSTGIGDSIIVGSSFRNNSCSNGGALGSLDSSLVVANSTLDGNRATGGYGGGISADGSGNTVSLCGVVLSSNQGQVLGGGMFHRGHGKEGVAIDRSIILYNRLGADSTGGGIYVENAAAMITNTSIVRNTAASAGGLAARAGAIIQLTNLTVSANTATTGQGGGLAFDSSVTGKIWNCTLAENRAPAPNGYGGAIAGGGSGIVLQNSLIVSSVVGSGDQPISCTQKLTAAGMNVQWPVSRAGGGSDVPDALCADGVLTQRIPVLWPLGDYGGLWPGLTYPPYCNDLVQRKGTGCPATDQLGRMRAEPCTLGASEACLID